MKNVVLQNEVMAIQTGWVIEMGPLSGPIKVNFAQEFPENFSPPFVELSIVGLNYKVFDVSLQIRVDEGDITRKGFIMKPAQVPQNGNPRGFSIRYFAMAIRGR